MTPGTALLVLHVEGQLAVMTPAAKAALRHFLHVHFVCAFFHLEGVIMAGAALESLCDRMFLMAEQDRCGVFGSKRQVPAANLLLRGSAEWNNHATYDHDE